MIKRQGKAGIAAGRGGIRIPANSPVIAGVRCTEGEVKELTGGATASAGERCGERAVWGRPGRDARASRACRAGRTGGGEKSWAQEGGSAGCWAARAERGRRARAWAALAAELGRSGMRGLGRMERETAGWASSWVGFFLFFFSSSISISNSNQTI